MEVSTPGVVPSLLPRMAPAWVETIPITAGLVVGSALVTAMSLSGSIATISAASRLASWVR